MALPRPRMVATVIVGAALLAAATLGFDIMTRHGIAAAVPHIVLVLLGLSLPWVVAPIALAALATVMIFVGYVLSPEGTLESTPLVNRGLTLFAVWVTAFLAARQMRLARQLRSERDGLEAEVARRTRDLKQMIERLLQEAAARHQAEDAEQEAAASRLRAEDRQRDAEEELYHVLRQRSVGQLASAFAHELSQPIGTIANYLQAMRRLIGSGQPVNSEKIAGFVEESVGQVKRAADIIRELRAFVERGETTFEIGDLNETVEEAARLGTIGSKGRLVELRMELAEEIPSFPFNETQINQVVFNLVRNAVEAMTDGGQRELTVSTIRVDQGSVGIRVSDTGPGIPAQIRERLFDRFATTKEKGMGLGLAICRSIVERHGGTIEAVSERGRGTTMRVTLPTGEEPVAHDG